MLSIKEFQIVKLEMDGFLIYEKPTTLLFEGNHVIITGDNRVGKTTIADAVAFTLYGCTYHGDCKVTQHFFNKNGCKKVVVKLTLRDAEGELHLIARKLTPSTNTITFDLNKTDQETIVNIFGSRDTFLSLWNPLYYLSLTQEKKRSLITSILPQIPDKDILEKFGEKAKGYLLTEGLSDPSYYLSLLRKEEDRLKKDLLKMEGQIQGIDLNIEIPEEVLFDEQELTTLNTCIENLISSKVDISAYKKQLTDLEAQLANTPLLFPVKETKTLADAKNSLLQTYNDTKKLLKKDEYSSLKCSECGQVLPVEIIQRLRNDSVLHNKKMISRMANIKERGQILAKQIADIKEENNVTLKKRDEFIKKISNDIRILKPRTTNEKNQQIETQINIIRNQLNSLDFQTANAIRVNSKRSTLIKLLENNKKDHSLKIQLQADLEAKLAENQDKIYTVKQYISEKSKALSNLLQQNLNKVSIVLENINKLTGEAVPCFDFTYEGTVETFFSGSERIKAGMEVGALIRKFTKMNFPTFIDESNIITFYNTDAIQVFEAFAVKNQPLSIKVADSIQKKEKPNATRNVSSKNNPMSAQEPLFETTTALIM
jgi:DNA repair exonuclease SbcCD ATPase subunit